MTSAANFLHRLAGAIVGVTLVAEPAAALAGPRAEGPQPAAVVPVSAEAVDPFADEQVHAWGARQRRLKIQLGVSAGLTAAFLLSGALALAIPMRCPEDSLCEPYGRFWAATVMFPASVVAAIPTAVYGVRLRRHNERRPVARLLPAPTGLVIRF